MAATAAATPPSGLPVRDNSTTFGLTPNVLDRFCRRAAHVLGPGSPFVDSRNEDRYVLVAVDPAAGGVLSDEAFIVFLVAGTEFGLLTGRIVPGHSGRYGFAMIPLVFVVALLQTVRATVRLLRAAHTGDAPFVMPPVLVLVENNFAYGASVYVQMLWFLRQRQRRHADLGDVEIVFVTPVYGMDRHLMGEFAKLRDLELQLKREEEQAAAFKEAVVQAWRSHGNRKVGLSQEVFLRKVKEALPAHLGPSPAAQARTKDLLTEEAGKILAEMVDALELDSQSDRAVLLSHWVREREMTRAATQLVLAAARRKDLRERITAQRVAITAYRSRHGEPGGTNDGLAGAHPFVRIRTWGAPGAPDHPFDPGTGAVTLGRHDHTRAAPKTLLGETTTLQEKAHAFNHYVELVKSLRPTLLLLDRPDRPPPATPPRPGAGAGGAAPPPPPPQPCTDIRDGAVHPSLPPADTVLRCVHRQWSRLAVWADPAQPTRAVRVEGKQAGPDAESRRDDAWMAFSIGVQWCTRLTLVPDPMDRKLLLGYMRSLGEDMERAMADNLRDADVLGEEDTGGAAAAAAAPPVPSHDRPPPPPPPALAPPTREALTVCTAVAHHLRRCCLSMHAVVRRLLIAYALHGHSLEGSGYQLTVVRVQRRSLLHDQRRWQELVVREVLGTGAPYPVDVRGLRARFGRSVTALRCVCGTAPGPRHAWPGGGPLPSAAGHKRPPADVVALPEALGRHLRVASRVVGWVERVHAPHHPVLGGGGPDAARLFGLLVQHLIGLFTDVRAILTDPELVPPDVRTTFDGPDSVATLNARLAHERQAAPPGTGPPRRTPLLLPAVYGMVADHLRVLRRLEDHGRELVIPALLRPTRASTAAAGQLLLLHRARVDIDVPADVAPALSVRCTSRPLLNWQHVFRGLFPDRHRELRRAAEREATVSIGYQSRLTFVGLAEE